MKLPSLETNALNSALAELKVMFGPAEGEQLQKFWDNDRKERDIISGEVEQHLCNLHVTFM